MLLWGGDQIGVRCIVNDEDVHGPLKQAVRPFQSFDATNPLFPPKSVPTRKTFPILGVLEAEDGMGAWETDWNRDVLERIVALLFSLAGLADIAAGLPALRRRQVLGILSVGEAEARAFLIGSGAPVSVDAPETAGDATRLAARLRALALLLCALLAQAALSVPAASRTGRPSHGISDPAVRWLDATALAPDTS